MSELEMALIVASAVLALALVVVVTYFVNLKRNLQAEVEIVRESLNFEQGRARGWMRQADAADRRTRVVDREVDKLARENKKLRDELAEWDDAIENGGGGGKFALLIFMGESTTKWGRVHAAISERVNPLRAERDKLAEALKVALAERDGELYYDPEDKPVRRALRKEIVFRSEDGVEHVYLRKAGTPGDATTVIR